jgi:hypothetical protein
VFCRSCWTVPVEQDFSFADQIAPVDNGKDFSGVVAVIKILMPLFLQVAIIF